ncbi:MAG: hypothetical protein CME59_08685 [Halioglobus sp.]|nr:hypothetical protein [Halioglobus sp.]
MFSDPVEEPVAAGSLSVYFMERLSEHARQLSPPPHEDTCWYIGSMLERFGRSDALFAYADGHYQLRPLALLYGDAREASNEHQRCMLLQQLGDMSLFLGALFPERFARRGIGQDYIAGMGGGAYDYLAGNARRNRHIFAELAGAFHHMLQLVASACSKSRLDAGDIITLYRHWQRTGDPVAMYKLQTLGVAVCASEATH